MVWKFKKPNKSLAAFTRHYLWVHEVNKGLSVGYMASLLAEMTFLSIRLDIGSKERTKRPALDSMRSFAEDYIEFRRKETVRMLRETPRKLFNNERRLKLHRQLMGIRVLRKRIREEVVKGNEHYPILVKP